MAKSGFMSAHSLGSGLATRSSASSYCWYTPNASNCGRLAYRRMLRLRGQKSLGVRSLVAFACGRYLESSFANINCVFRLYKVLSPVLLR